MRKDEAFYYYYYRGRLKSLIGKTQCTRYNPLKTSDSDILDSVDAYIRARWFEKNVNIIHMIELLELFSDAVPRYFEKYRQFSLGFAPGNYDSYLEVIEFLN